MMEIKNKTERGGEEEKGREGWEERKENKGKLKEENGEKMRWETNCDK